MRVDEFDEFLQRRGGIEVLHLVVKHSAITVRAPIVRLPLSPPLAITYSNSRRDQANQTPVAEPLGGAEMLDQLFLLLAGEQAQRGGRPLGPILGPLLGIRLGQQVEKEGIVGECWCKPLGQMVDGLPRLLVDQPGDQFGQRIRIAAFLLDQPADRIMAASMLPSFFSQAT